jgi:hypothetical protein
LKQKKEEKQEKKKDRKEEKQSLILHSRSANTIDGF